jgi:hypothetical protein
MAEYSKEYAKMKGEAAQQLKQFIADIKSGAVQIGGNEPKMSLRALRTLLLSEDKVYGDLVENLLSGKLTIEQFKNKIRSVTEKRVPERYKILPSDRIHHGTPLEIGAILQEMPDEELRTLLTDYGSQGTFFGDTEENVKGRSFDERAHTGARPKQSKSKIIYPATEGEAGLRGVSAHPRGTRDPMYNIPDRPVTAAEGRQVLDPLIEQARADVALGELADAPRRATINEILTNKGLLKQGEDIFSQTISSETLVTAQKVLKDPDLQLEIAQSFRTPTPILKNVGGTVVTTRGLTARPTTGISMRKSAGSVLPLVGVAAGVMSAGQSFAAGDPREGTARLLETGAGEIPVIGDIVQPESVAGGTFEDVERRTAEGIRAKQLQQRATEARQRGGKLSFGIGSARFTLPEFGLSELMGIN